MSHLALLKDETQAIKNPLATFQTLSPRTSVNKGKEKDRRLLCSEGEQVHPKHCFTQAKAPPERGLPSEREPP
jgi:hypothetical protein